MEAGNSKIFRVGRLKGWKPREELMLQLEFEDCLLEEFPLPPERSVFSLLRPSTDWMKPTHFI
jgi:hypothetical protein